MIYKFLKYFSKYVASRSNLINVEFEIAITDPCDSTQKVMVYPSTYINIRSSNHHISSRVFSLSHIFELLNMDVTQLDANTVIINTTKLLPGVYEYKRPFNRKQRVWIKY